MIFSYCPICGATAFWNTTVPSRVICFNCGSEFQVNGLVLALIPSARDPEIPKYQDRQALGKTINGEWIGNAFLPINGKEVQS